MARLPVIAEIIAMVFIRDPRLQLILALLFAATLSVYLFRRVLRRTTRRLHREAPTEERHLIASLLHAAIAPLSFLAWYYVLFGLGYLVLLGDWIPAGWDWPLTALRHLSAPGLFVGFLWYFYAASSIADARLRRIAARTRGKLDDVLFPLLGTGLRVVVPIFAVFLFLRLWPLSPGAMAVAQKLLAIALIGAITWIVRRAILLVDAVILGAEALSEAASADRRALYTRVRMLRRIAMVLLGLFAFAAVLMLFEEVRDVGRSILASAGIAGIVLGIAAQRSLGNLLAGIQIALTQPIRLGDQVIVEGDFANIEEITLTYVIARTWDSRRIVLPISYFIEKPFQNWTHGAATLLSALVLKVDFSLPVRELRSYMQQEIARSRFWDGKVFGVQVVDSDDRSMQVRVLASAPDSGASWDLRCELREKAIDFIRQNYPECLPKIRAEQRRIEEWSESAMPHDGHAPLAGLKRH